jgi:hypothetical protein
VIRKRLQRWFETGDAGGLDHGAGLGSATFRQILLMGYGQVKHSMESGDKQRESLIFLGIRPWERRGELDDITDRMLADRALEEKTKALEKAQPPGVVIDTKAGDQDKDGEPLELIDADPPEHPSAWR